VSQSFWKYLHGLSFLAAGLAACLLVPRRIEAQARTYSPEDVDAHKVLPLDLKPGCWQVATHGSGIADPIQTPEEIAATMTPEQRAALTPEQLAQAIASLQASEKFGAQLAQKGGGTTAVACTWTPFFEVGIEVYGTAIYGIAGAANRCTRTIQVSGEKRNIHVACPTKQGDATVGRSPTRITDEYERLDSENFRGIQHRVTDLGGGRTDDTTTLIVAKWTGDAAPHMPHSPAPTGINGKKPVGPQAVAWLDPYRIVATVGGRQFLAAQTYVLTIFSTAKTNKEYGPRLSGIFQQLMIHAGVAAEAVQLHLDLQQPWLNQLKTSGCDARDLGPFGSIVAPQSPPQNPFDIHAIWAVTDALARPATWTDTHAEMARFSSLAHQTVVEILWNAYFSRAKTEAEKQALLHTVQEKYKVTVIDPDFFYGERSP